MNVKDTFFLSASCSAGRVGAGKQRGDRGFPLTAGHAAGKQRCFLWADTEKRSSRGSCGESKHLRAASASSAGKVNAVFRLRHQLADRRPQLYHHNNYCDGAHTDPRGASSPRYPEQRTGNINLKLFTKHIQNNATDIKWMKQTKDNRNTNF